MAQVIVDGFARFQAAPDYPFGQPLEEWHRRVREARVNWGTRDYQRGELRRYLPSFADDPEFVSAFRAAKQANKRRLADHIAGRGARARVARTHGLRPARYLVTHDDLVVLATLRSYDDATGTPYATTWFDMFRVTNGKISEHWDYETKK